MASQKWEAFFIFNQRLFSFRLVGNQNGPQSRRPKNTNDEKNLFRKIQIEFVDNDCLNIFSYCTFSSKRSHSCSTKSQIYD